MSNQDIQQLTDQAFKYGPFFFSILFVIFLTRWAYKKYSAAIAQSPPIDPADKKVNRTMFLSTFFFGLALVVVSVVWWWWFKPSVYLFMGKLEDLQPQVELAADMYYLKREYRGALSDQDNVGQLRNEEFVILSQKPFGKDQWFTLEISKNHQRREKVYLQYENNGEEPIYTVEYDQTNQRSFLKKATQGAPSSAGTSGRMRPFEQSVYADSQSGQKTTVTKRLPTQQADTQGENLIRTLQDPRSSVGVKLNAIDILNAKSPTELRGYLDLPGTEQFALTIFDLTQHSDPELATKATLLTKNADVDGYLIEQLSSHDQARRQSAEKILMRISRPHAQALLKSTGGLQYPDLRMTAEKISGGQTQVVKATASSDGDRYYVKATWDANNPAVVDCLTKVFNSELITQRTPAEESALMHGKSQRFVYWYSKDWAIGVSRQIAQCGGKAEFVKAY